MHIAVQQGLQRMGSYDFGDLLGQEIDLQLNRMQERFVKQKFDVSNSDPLGFQETQKRLDDLRTLIREQTYNQVVPSGNLGENPDYNTLIVDEGQKWYVRFPDGAGQTDEYLFLINARIKVKVDENCPDSSATETPIRLIKRDVLPRMLRHPFGKSTFINPIGAILDDKLYIYGDGQMVVQEVYIDFIKKPRDVVYGPGHTPPVNNTSDSELPDHTHNEIVDMTVRHMAALLQAPNYQQQVIETQQNE